MCQYIEENEELQSSVPTSVGAHYIMALQLGSGAFGTVRLVVRRNTGTRFAMKQIEMSPYTTVRLIIYFVL